MAHMEKFTMGAASGVLLHDERSETEDRTRSNVDIDPNRTHLNYNLLKEPVSARDFGKYLSDFTSQNEIYLLNRKDVNVLTSWIVTLPTEVKQEEQEHFFYEAYRFLCERYGFKETSKNIISAAVHMDETTPHLHFKFIPVAYDSKKQRFTVSAKKVVDRKDLQTFHKDLSERMKQVFGRDVGILNGETQNVRNVAELKSRGGKIEKQLAQAEKDLKIAQNEAQGVLRRAEDKASEITLAAEDAEREAYERIAGAECNTTITTEFRPPALRRDTQPQRYTHRRVTIGGEKVETAEYIPAEVENVQKIAMAYLLDSKKRDEDDKRRAIEQAEQDERARQNELRTRQNDERARSLDTMQEQLEARESALSVREAKLKHGQDEIKDVFTERNNLIETLEQKCKTICHLQDKLMYYDHVCAENEELESLVRRFKAITQRGNGEISAKIDIEDPQQLDVICAELNDANCPYVISYEAGSASLLIAASDFEDVMDIVERAESQAQQTMYLPRSNGRSM